MSKKSLRIFIISVLLLAVALAAFVFSVYVIRHSEAKLSAQLEALAKERQQQEHYFEIEKLHETSAADRTSLDRYLLTSEGGSIDILTQIETLAPQAGVVLETKNLQKVNEKETKTDWIEVTFAFSGDRASVERFVSVLETLPYVSHITNLSLSARASNNWEAVTTFRIRLYTS